jgi:hypothetical protein
MCPRPYRTGIRAAHCVRTEPIFWLSLAICALSFGCEAEPRQVGDQPVTLAKAKVKPQPIINRRTQEIRNAASELQGGKAKVATTKITAKDYITLQGNAYVTTIGRVSQLEIQHAIDLYQAENGRYPKDYDEFMTVIIKANNIALPVLPPYQEYGYDEKEHKLLILEYPDRKNQPAPR